MSKPWPARRPSKCPTDFDLDDKGEVVGFDIDHTSQRLDLATLETEDLPDRSYKAG